MATIFGFPYMGCTLAPPEEYDWTVHVRRRCGLMSNYGTLTTCYRLDMHLVTLLKFSEHLEFKKHLLKPAMSPTGLIHSSCTNCRMPHSLCRLWHQYTSLQILLYEFWIISYAIVSKFCTCRSIQHMQIVWIYRALVSISKSISMSVNYHLCTLKRDELINRL